MRLLSEATPDEEVEIGRLVKAGELTLEDNMDDFVHDKIDIDELWEENYNTRQWVKKKILEILAN